MNAINEWIEWVVEIMKSINEQENAKVLMLVIFLSIIFYFIGTNQYKKERAGKKLASNLILIAMGDKVSFFETLTNLKILGNDQISFKEICKLLNNNRSSSTALILICHRLIEEGISINRVAEAILDEIHNPLNFVELFLVAKNEIQKTHPEIKLRSSILSQLSSQIDFLYKDIQRHQAEQLARTTQEQEEINQARLQDETLKMFTEGSKREKRRLVILRLTGAMSIFSLFR